MFVGFLFVVFLCAGLLCVVQNVSSVYAVGFLVVMFPSLLFLFVFLLVLSICGFPRGVCLSWVVCCSSFCVHEEACVSAGIICVTISMRVCFPGHPIL